MKDFEGQIETLLNHHKLLDEQKQTLKAYDQTLHRASAKSKLVYLERLKRFGVFVGKPYKDVSREDIDRFLNSIISDNQYNNFITTFKRFFSWLGKGKIVKSLKMRNVDLSIPASELLTHEEVIELANKTGSPMYKASILTLYESCARVSEVLALKIGDVTFSSVRDKEDRNHIIATLNFPKAKGKISKPPVSISMFALELKQWIESHPYKENPQAYIFYSPKFSPQADKPLTGDMVNFILKQARKLTNIKKRVNPHWLRHSGLSFLANNLNYSEILLQWRAGWKNPTMAKRYVHSGADIQNGEYLKRLGLKVEEKEKAEIIKPKPCPHCNQLNPYTNINCNYCGMPLDLEKYKAEMEARQKAYVTKLTESQKMEIAKHVEYVKQLPEGLAEDYLSKLLETWMNTSQKDKS
jgi:site-specific recombinase XerD